jgi:prolyl oligopeptidase
LRLFRIVALVVQRSLPAALPVGKTPLALHLLTGVLVSRSIQKLLGAALLLGGSNGAGRFERASMRRGLTLLPLLALTMATNTFAQPAAPTYPQTRQGDVVEQKFGETIHDPYRWLENNVRSDKEVADWVERENAVTQTYLAQLPARDWFASNIRELTDFERFGLPHKAGHRYFYLRNAGLQNQAQLFVRDGLHGEPRLLLDPNTWAKDGATALDQWVPSPDGRHLAYSIQDGGSDWRSLKVVDVATGKLLPDEIHWVKESGIAWVGMRASSIRASPSRPRGRISRRSTTITRFISTVWARPRAPTSWSSTRPTTATGTTALR